METILKEAKVIFLEAFLILCFSHTRFHILVKIQKYLMILFFTIRLWMFTICVPSNYYEKITTVYSSYSRYDKRMYGSLSYGSKFLEVYNL